MCIDLLQLEVFVVFILAFLSFLLFLDFLFIQAILNIEVLVLDLMVRRRPEVLTCPIYVGIHSNDLIWTFPGLGALQVLRSLTVLTDKLVYEVDFLGCFLGFKRR